MKNEILTGILAGTLLLGFYLLVMILSTGSWEATLEQFQQFWYWTLLLIIGFGIQVGLYAKLKAIIKNPSSSVNQITATTTGTSIVTMIACCLHHLSDVLPIIALSGAAVFMTRYQVPLIIVGIVMNIFAIIYILKMINKVKNSELKLI